jgi:hypothetical protein
MTSFRKLKGLAHTASFFMRDNTSGLDALHVSIYDLAIHGFMSEVLTIARMTRVVVAVRNGIDDSTHQASGANISIQALSQREAYRGLCTAATEGLTAVALAHVELRKFSGNSLSSEFAKALLQISMKYKQQLDLINARADWLSNRRIILKQSHWFDKLLYTQEQDSKKVSLSSMSWSSIFFQACGYEEKSAKSEVDSSLMLLGLITSGTLAGLRTVQAAS